MRTAVALLFAAPPVAAQQPMQMDQAEMMALLGGNRKVKTGTGKLRGGAIVIGDLARGVQLDVAGRHESDASARRASIASGLEARVDIVPDRRRRHALRQQFSHAQHDGDIAV